MKEKNDALYVDTCLGNIEEQRWTYDKDGTIRHSNGFCLELEIRTDYQEVLIMAECDKNKETQKWQWSKNEKKRT